MTPKALLALMVGVACVLAPVPSHASDIDLVHAGVRWRTSNRHVLGKVEPERFREYDVWATVRLAWESYSASGWGVGTRLLTSAGLFRGAGTNALVVSALPMIALGSRDGRFTFDVGVGLAVLSKSKYGRQDFGGILQASLTSGIGIPIYRRFGAGYRFMHYSDAGVFGSHTIGADLHMLDLTYRF
jgi:hypothetical protein